MIFMKILKNTIQIKKRKIFPDMFRNKKLNSIVTELFNRSRKLNISFVFIKQSYFAVSKNIRLNIKPETNASKITNGTCTSKSREYI